METSDDDYSSDGGMHEHSLPLPPPPASAFAIPSGTHRQVIYFCRHAEALHNVKEREAVAQAMAAGYTAPDELTAARKAVLRQDNGTLRDAPLSAEGAVQAKASGQALRSLFATTPTQQDKGRSENPLNVDDSHDTSSTGTSTAASTPFRRPDIVLVSPLRRALMTATQLFYHPSENDNVPPPRFVAMEALREKRTGLDCDERLSVAELSSEFPHVDFTYVPNGAVDRDNISTNNSTTRDVNATPSVPLGEDNMAVRARCAAFLQHVLPGVQGQYLAIVSHKGWLRELRATLKAQVDAEHLKADFDLGSNDWHTTLYGNAEVRVASLTWQDGELVSLTSRSMANAQVLAQAAAMMGDGFEFATAPSSGFSIFLADRTTKVHFISLPQAAHHVALRDAASINLDVDTMMVRPAGMPLTEHALHDPRLTPTGRKQARKLRQMLATRPSGGRPFTAFDVVLVSPLTRACESAEIMFGRSPGTFGGVVLPPPRIIVDEECRERYGRYVCDARRSVKELSTEFPHFVWDNLRVDALDDEGTDPCWTDDRETATHVRERALRLLQRLSDMPYRCVAVVTHAEFLRHLFGQFASQIHAQLHPDDRASGQWQQRTSHCELRSVVLCAHGAVASRTESSSNVPSSTIRVPSSSSLSSLASFSALPGGQWAEGSEEHRPVKVDKEEPKCRIS